MKKIRALTKQLEKDVTKALKDRIINLDLIDTGLMLSKTHSKITIRGFDLDLNIKSTDYFKYLDGDYDIVDWVLNLPSIINQVSEIQTELMFKESGWEV